jgi:hypothetical protein
VLTVSTVLYIYLFTNKLTNIASQFSCYAVGVASIRHVFLCCNKKHFCAMKMHFKTCSLCCSKNHFLYLKEGFFCIFRVKSYASANLTLKNPLRFLKLSAFTYPPHWTASHRKHNPWYSLTTLCHLNNFCYTTICQLISADYVAHDGKSSSNHLH